MLRLALTVLQFFCALVIIGLVLIQRGKGAEAGAGFGAGASGTVFGARGAGTALSRATAIFAALFMLNSLALGYVGSHQTERPKTIFDTAGEGTVGVPTGRLPAIPPNVPATGTGTSPPASTPGTLPSGSSPGAPATNAPPQTQTQPAPATGAAPTQTPAAPARN